MQPQDRHATNDPNYAPDVRACAQQRRRHIQSEFNQITVPAPGATCSCCGPPHPRCFRCCHPWPCLARPHTPPTGSHRAPWLAWCLWWALQQRRALQQPVQRSPYLAVPHTEQLVQVVVTRASQTWTCPACTRPPHSPAPTQHLLVSWRHQA